VTVHRVRGLVVALVAVITVAALAVVPTPAPADAATQPGSGITTDPMPAGTPIEWDSQEQVALRRRTDACGPVSALSPEEQAEVCGKPLPEGQEPAYEDEDLQARLADFSVSVSQTSNLRNQVVQVRWDSGLEQRADVQIMQCWSESPTVAPDREQCEFGGKHVSDLYEGTLSAALIAESRRPGRDPEYRGFGNAASWAAVGGQNASLQGPVSDWAGRERADPLYATWQSSDELQIGLDDAGAGLSAYDVTLIPPSGAVRTDGSALPARIPLVAVDEYTDAGRVEIPGRTQPYDFVTDRFSLSAAAVEADVDDDGWPSGRYEIELAQTLTQSNGVVVRRDRVVLVREERFVDGDFFPVWRQGGGGETAILTVPFDPFGDTAARRPTSDSYPLSLSEWVNTRSTNEAVRAPGVTNGTGLAAFEVFTDLESQGLACGRPSTPTATCWIVVVPRFARAGDADYSLSASPLDLSLWDLRLNVRLGFVPTVVDCDASGDLRQIYTNDIGHTAVQSWQAELCRLDGAESTVSRPQQDFLVRELVSAPNRLGVVGVPPESDTQVSAPLAVGGLAFAFAIDELWYAPQQGGDAGERNQTRVTSMNLTPRLVAKLLTQSYTTGALPNGPTGTQNVFGLQPQEGETFAFEPARNLDPDNATNLLTDPEFLAINPQIVEWVRSWSDNDQQLPVGLQQNLATVIFADVASDSYNTLWRWILSDEDARDFLSGEPDENGMTVNPYHRGSVTETSDGIRLRDSTCADYLTSDLYDRVEDICTINFQSRTETVLETALFASRGDSRRQTTSPLQGCDPRVNAVDCLWRRDGRQTVATSSASGVALIALTTTPLARRLGLPVAALGTADGVFVDPSEESLGAALGSMPRRDDGVLLSDPEQYPDDAYPLTAVSYGAVDVCQATGEQRAGFAAILDYAVGGGQETGLAPGQLPPGYLPLPSALATRTRDAAATLRDPPAELLDGCPTEPGAPAPGNPVGTPTPAPAPAGAGQPPPSVTSGTLPAPSATSSPVGSSAAGAPAAAAPAAGASPAANEENLDVGSGVGRVATPVPEDAYRWLIPLVLGLGVAAGVAGSVLTVVSRRRPSGP
jgi:hypothetical protein